MFVCKHDMEWLSRKLKLLQLEFSIKYREKNCKIFCEYRREWEMLVFEKKLERELELYEKFGQRLQD